ncbi:MAG: hydrogenase iron-sulfur subunit [Anaerolineales bacterium]|nr:hydrogenase iron-sulfur subunit [Anaerolineales bacterium]MDW8447243.1 hydrogenase iron-sulfur subunit [Anaerolineales bacterium]
MAEDFEPQITAFYCIYCGYMAADTAGILHIQYPANVKFVRLPCTGKTDIRYILEAFEQGADGVYLVACPIGNCHHVRGNERGWARVKRAKKILDEIGLGGERLEMFFMSGSQGGAFAIAAQTMTERIRRMGPNPIRLSEVRAGRPDTETEKEDSEEVDFRGRRSKKSG